MRGVVGGKFQVEVREKLELSRGPSHDSGKNARAKQISPMEIVVDNHEQ